MRWKASIQGHCHGGKVRLVREPMDDVSKQSGSFVTWPHPPHVLITTRHLWYRSCLACYSLQPGGRWIQIRMWPTWIQIPVRYATAVRHHISHATAVRHHHIIHATATWRHYSTLCRSTHPTHPQHTSYATATWRHYSTLCKPIPPLTQRTESGPPAPPATPPATSVNPWCACV